MAEPPPPSNNAQVAAPPAGPQPLASSDEIYVPDNDEVELLDSDGPDTMQRGQAYAARPANSRRAGLSDSVADDEEEIIPTSGEMDFIDQGVSAHEPPPPSLERTPTPSFRPGVISYGAPLPPDAPPAEEEMIPSDGELELVDANAAPAPSGAAAPSDFAGEPLAGELVAGEPLDGGALDGELAPISAELQEEPMPLESPEAAPAAASPWATAAAEASIDLRDLPSSHAPFASAAPVEQKKADEASTPQEARGGARSWVTLFLVIALVASVVTFLLLSFNIVGAPEGKPSAGGPPIQVPTVGPATPPAPVVPAPPATQEPVEVAAPEPSASAAAPEPSAAAPEPPVTAEPAASAPVAAPVTSTPVAPVQPASSAGKPPTTTTKPGGAPPTGKKPSRIF
jgi:hypothetical protein